jgi:hypothetical protein
MKYINKTGFICNFYYEFIVVDLFCDTDEDGDSTIPLFQIRLLKPKNSGFAIVFKTPWTSIGLGINY